MRRFIRVRVTKPEIQFQRDRRFRHAVAFVCRVVPAIWVQARVLRVHALVSALLIFTTSCGFAERHPVRAKVIGLVSGAAVGTAIALATRHNCASTYDGKPYQGTPPCPK